MENGKLVLGVDRHHWFEVDIALAGPLLFLGLDRLVTRVASEIHDVQELLLYDDHPPSEMRIAAVLEAYKAIGFAKLPSMSAFCLEWLELMEGAVLQIVKDNLPAIRTRFRNRRR
jgi:hypothetical protein